MPVGHSARFDKLRDTPRPIRLRPGAKAEGRSIWFFILLPHTYVGALVGAFILFQLYVAVAAPVVDGRVTDRRVTRSSKSTHYALTYTYTANGQPRTNRESVAEQRYDDYQIGSSVKVRAFYVGRWGGAHLVGNSDAPKFLFMLFWVVGWNAIVCVIFYNQYVLPRRRRWLLANGDVARGVIASVTRPDGNKNRQWQVKYEYRLLDGQPFQGAATVPTRAAPPEDFLSQGRELTVFFSPDKPHRSVALELTPYEIPGAESLTAFAPATPAPAPSTSLPTPPTRPLRKATPLPPPPRQIRRIGGKLSSVWFVRGVVIVFLLVGFNTGRYALQELAMATLARPATATVIRNDVHTNPNGTKQVGIVYAYNDGGGRHEAITPSNDATTKPVGSTFPVKAVHLGRIGWSNPASKRVNGTSLCCLLPFTLVWNVVVLSLAYTLIVGNWRRRRLLKFGETAEGVIVARNPVEGSNTTAQVVYEFTTSWGERCVKHFPVLANQQAEWEIGDRFTVLYWPTKPSRATPYRGPGAYAILNDRGDPIET